MGAPGFHISRALAGLWGARVSHFTGLRGASFTFHGPSGGQGFTFHGPFGGPGFHISRALGGGAGFHISRRRQGFTFHGPWRRRGFHISRRALGGQGFTFHAPSGDQGFTFHAGPSGGARVSHFTGFRGTARVSHFTPGLRGAPGFHISRRAFGGDARVSHFTGLSRVSQITGLRTGWGHQGLTFVGSLRVPSFFAFHELSEGGQGSRGLQCHDHGVTGITTIREVTGSHWSRFRLSRKHSHRRVEQLFLGVTTRKQTPAEV